MRNQEIFDVVVTTFYREDVDNALKAKNLFGKTQFYQELMTAILCSFVFGNYDKDKTIKQIGNLYPEYIRPICFYRESNNFFEKNSPQDYKYDKLKYFVDNKYNGSFEEFDKKYVHYCSYCNSWETEHCICYAR